jgi:hypothetical protein
LMRQRLHAGRLSKVQRGEYVQRLPTGLVRLSDKLTVCSFVASRNLLLYQSLPMSTPGRHAIVRRRKDDLCVGAALGRTAT